MDLVDKGNGGREVVSHFIDEHGNRCENLGAGSRFCRACGGTHVVFATALDWSGATGGVLFAHDARRFLVCPLVDGGSEVRDGERVTD